MLELSIKVFIGYSILKYLYHILLEGHHPKKVWRAMNEAGSTVQYKVKQKD